MCVLVCMDARFIVYVMCVCALCVRFSVYVCVSECSVCRGRGAMYEPLQSTFMTPIAFGDG
jgi:hypothetical protein